MEVFDYKYLSDKQLKGLNSYKYSCIDTSPVSNYVMQPFWNRCVEYFPIWFAPNLMTLLGFLLLVVNFLLFSIYDYHFYDASSIPRWLWLVAAICQFGSHQLDGMDGKQARRAKASSALGELFDHGVDSWATFLFPVCIFSVLSRGEYGFSVLTMHFLLWTVYTSFIDSHWEKYNTKVLYLPWSYDISMLVMTLTYLVAFFFSPSIFCWRVPIINVAFAHVAQVIWPCFALGTSLPISVINIRKAYKNRTGNNRTPYEAIRPLIAPSVLFISSTWWALSSPNMILQKQPRVFFSAIGATFSNIACRLVVAQMTSTRAEGFNSFLYIYVPIQCLVVFGKLTKTVEFTLLYVYNIYAIIFHIHYAVCVVRQICEHLQIYCFNITARRPPPAQIVIQH
ncbi:unnamed protein product [Didymodactylos carnosus]|uniref:Ethanolaminephosphotransferase n=2 Tax=Didymodactylos carnosus TaxID=1234261 RepID=A0A814PIM2_9BILA|nr:unnamed protein product [Didymodactylos carnosus]CAF3869470.1 unnamed protein product [Didymodactylos carnosus]